MTDLSPGEKAYVNNGGYLSLAFPFNAGTYTAYSCTNLYLQESRVTNRGGLRVTIEASQRLFCPRYYRTTFDYRESTNPDTKYNLLSNGQLAIITGTSGEVKPFGKDGAIFSVTQGSIEVKASNGDEGIVFAGEMGIASSDGLRIGPIPDINYTVEGRPTERPDFYRICFDEGIQAEVAGKSIESGDWFERSGANKVKLTSPSDAATFRIP